MADLVPSLILRRRYLYSPRRKLPSRAGDINGGQRWDRSGRLDGHRKRREGEGGEAQGSAGPYRGEDEGTRGRTPEARRRPTGPPEDGGDPRQAGRQPRGSRRRTREGSAGPQGVSGKARRGG